MECNLGWNHMHDFKIEWVHSASSIWNHKYRILDQNCTAWGSITTLLHPFWNCPNTELGQFNYFIDVVLNRSETKFIHFLGGKAKSFGKLTKNAKFATWYSLSLIFSAIWSAIWSVKQALKSDWLFCF